MAFATDPSQLPHQDPRPKDRSCPSGKAWHLPSRWVLFCWVRRRSYWSGGGACALALALAPPSVQCLHLRLRLRLAASAGDWGLPGEDHRPAACRSLRVTCRVALACNLHRLAPALLAPGHLASGTLHPASYVPSLHLHLPARLGLGVWHLLSPKQNQDLDRARLGASRLNSPTFTSRASSTNSRPPLVSRPLFPANCHGQGNALSAVKAFSSLPRPRLRCSSASSLPHHHNSAHMGCRSLT